MLATQNVKLAKDGPTVVYAVSYDKDMQGKLPKALAAPKKSGACREASACCLGAPR